MSAFDQKFKLNTTIYQKLLSKFMSGAFVLLKKVSPDPHEKTDVKPVY